jgi:hypothetical protein
VVGHQRQRSGASGEVLAGPDRPAHRAGGRRTHLDAREIQSRLHQVGLRGQHRGMAVGGQVGPAAQRLGDAARVALDRHHLPGGGFAGLASRASARATATRSGASSSRNSGTPTATVWFSRAIAARTVPAISALTGTLPAFT